MPLGSFYVVIQTPQNLQYATLSSERRKSSMNFTTPHKLRNTPGRLVIIALCGLVLALIIFFPIWWLQLLAFVCIAPVFLVVRAIPVRLLYVAGLLFFGAWLLPTTYWYYSFMTTPVAIASSVGFVALMANIFWLFSLAKLKKMPYAIVMLIVITIWTAFTYVRLHIPVLEDWWIPHLGYAVWQNSGVLQIGQFGGEAAVIFTVLLSNLLIALAVLSHKKAAAIAVPAAIIGLVVVANVVIWQQSTPITTRVIAVQQAILGGVDSQATANDIEKLANATSQQTPSSGDIAVWPENAIPNDLQPVVADKANQLNIFIVAHFVEEQGDDRFKKVTIFDPEGNVVLENYKVHIAPDETGDSRYTAAKVIIDGTVTTAYVCYDMHYPDSVERIGDAKLVLVPIDDATYGNLQKTFHAADLAMRAVQSNANIVSAATDGPTIYVNQNGVMESSLKFDEDGVLNIDAQ